MPYLLEGLPLRNTFWKCMGMFWLSLWLRSTTGIFRGGGPVIPTPGLSLHFHTPLILGKGEEQSLWDKGGSAELPPFSPQTKSDGWGREKVEAGVPAKWPTEGSPTSGNNEGLWHHKQCGLRLRTTAHSHKSQLHINVILDPWIVRDGNHPREGQHLHYTGEAQKGRPSAQGHSASGRTRMSTPESASRYQPFHLRFSSWSRLSSQTFFSGITISNVNRAINSWT